MNRSGFARDVFWGPQNDPPTFDGGFRILRMKQTQEKLVPCLFDL